MLKPAIAVAAILTASAACADAQLAQLLADSQRAPQQAFERTMRAELRADPAKEPAVVVDRFTPANGGHWELISIDGRKPSAEEAEAHARANRTPPGFHNLHRILSAPPSRRTVAGGATIFHWNSLPKGAVNTPGGDISAKLSAELTTQEVDGRLVPQKLRIFAAQPFKVRVVASINRFNLMSDYGRGPNGLPFLTMQSSDTDVTAPMGLGGKRRNTSHFRPI